MTPADLETLCKPLGHGWRLKLARHLGVNDRTIRRKISGESSISKAEEAEIRRFVQRKTKGGASAPPSLNRG